MRLLRLVQLLPAEVWFGPGKPAHGVPVRHPFSLNRAFGPEDDETEGRIRRALNREEQPLITNPPRSPVRQLDRRSREATVTLEGAEGGLREKDPIAAQLREFDRRFREEPRTPWEETWRRPLRWATSQGMLGRP